MPQAPARASPSRKSSASVLVAGLARAPWLHAALLGVLAVACYANALWVPLHIDDTMHLVDAPSMADIHLGAFLSDPRWFARATFALQYRLTGLELVPLHIFNVIVHALTSVVVYVLSADTLALSRGEREPAPAARAGALIAAALFAAHPLQTQAVTYLIQRMASLCALLYLLALVLHLRGRLASGRRAVALHAASVAAAVLAMKSKEIAFTFPFAVLLYDLAFLPGPRRRRWIALAPVLLTVVVVPLSWLRLDAPGATLGSAMGQATRAHPTLSRKEYLLTEMPVVASYLRLLAVPAGQNVDHDVPLHRAVDGEVLASAVLLAACLAAGAIALASCRSERWAPLRAAGYGAVLFFVALSVESSVIPILDVMVEHRVYLPSAGAALACGAGLQVAIEAIRGSRARLVLAAAAAVWVLALVGATLSRNEIWRTPVSLWEDAVAKSPRKARAWFALGTARIEAGDVAGARRDWETSLALDPNSSLTLNQLANLRSMDGDRAGAQLMYDMAIAADPENAEAHYNLARLLEDGGRPGDAVAHYRAFVRTAPPWLAGRAADVRARLGGPEAGGR